VASHRLGAANPELASGLAGLEDVLHPPFVNPGRSLIEFSDFAPFKPPAQGPNIFLGLLHGLGTENWHRAFADAPVEGYLGHSFVASFSNSLKTGQERSRSRQMLPKQQTPKALGEQSFLRVFAAQQPLAQGAVGNQLNTQLITHCFQIQFRDGIGGQ